MIINKEKGIGLILESTIKNRNEHYTDAFTITWGIPNYELNKIIYIHTNSTFEYLKNRYGPTGIFTPTQKEFDTIVEMLL